MNFTPPVDDLLFSLETACGGDLTRAGPDLDRNTARAILEAAGRFAAEVLAPLDRVGDRLGATYADGKVIAPPGFADAYRQFADAGWGGLSADPAWGGQGLPKVLSAAVFEMMQAANMAFGLCPMLTEGAIEALAANGSEQQKSLYLPRLVRGDWTGTMALTEPQAGSDLGALTTRAEPDGAGGYRLHGQKIFITWGDHDMAENILHLVLARLPDAPAGMKGISLFVAPRMLIDSGGATTDVPNSVAPVGIEHKLGIHGSPTCVMAFDGAAAELVGAPNRGLSMMFVMMNAARLHVGIQGVGVAERSFQKARAYSLERRQGRSAWTGDYPARLFDHPDIRATLALIKAKIEAARAICLSTALASDVAATAEDPERQALARLREELLTPIAKAWSTDLGVEAASAAIQIHGGMGFIEETGIARHYRDARILPIYEGANGIQAIDLVGRKLGLNGGKAVQLLLDDIAQDAEVLVAHGNEHLRHIGLRLRAALGPICSATDWMRTRHVTVPADALAGASAYLTLLGDLVGGWLLGLQALAATEESGGDDGGGPEKARIALAAIYANHVLASAPGRADALTCGSSQLARLAPEALGA